jgi:hypothetical protein
VPTAKSLAERIDLAFAPYVETLRSLDSCLAQHSDPTEFIILACARLDSLANLSFDESQQKCFCRLLREHSGHQRLLSEVSVPDLFNFLDHQLFMVNGTVRTPGRLTTYDDRGRLFAQLLVSSDLALDPDTATRLLRLLRRILRKAYRVSPRQPYRLAVLASEASLRTLFEQHAKTRVGKPYATALVKMGAVVREYTLDRLLYRTFRCGAIHEFGGPPVDAARFYAEDGVYWSELHNEHHPSKVCLGAHFSARFLREVLANVVAGYKAKLKSTRRLPVRLFMEVCDLLKELEHLDEHTLENPGMPASRSRC